MSPIIRNHRCDEMLTVCAEMGRSGGCDLTLNFTVALLPITGAMARASTPVPTAKATIVSMPDCCDRDDGMPMDHTSKNDMGNECQANADCAAKCFSLYAVIFWGPF